MGFTCCKKSVDYTGCLFYKKLNLKLEKTDKEDVDKVFGHTEIILNNFENSRQFIADAFKLLTKITGTCVLKNPDLEQCVRAFFIKLLVEFFKLIPKGKDEAEELKKVFEIFEFSTKAPFFSVNNEKLNKVKEKFNANPINKDIEEIINQINDYMGKFDDFVNSLKAVDDEIKAGKQDCLDLIENIKNDKQQYGSVLPKVLRNMNAILDRGNVFLMLKEVIDQFGEVVEKLQSVLSDPKEMLDLIKLSKDMYDKQIFEIKQLCWETTNEERLSKFEDWENNFEYRVVGELKTDN